MQKKLIRLIGILLASLILPTVSNAASITTTVCPGAGCVDFSTGNNGSIGIQITGTWSGTITFQTSSDNSTFVSFRVVKTSDTTATGITTTTSNGVFQGTITGVSIIRVVFTSWVSGTAVVTSRTTNTAAKFTNPTTGGAATPGGNDTDVQYN